MRKELERKFTLSPEVLMQELSGESVLLDLKSEQYFGLDAVGTRIWQLIEQDGDLINVFEQLLDEYEVEAEQLERDIIELVDQLLEAGLVILDPEDESVS